MNTTDRTAAIVAAARRRHDDTRRRAVEALRRLDASGEPISISAVAHAANVSRAWLYRQVDLRAQIDGLRRTRPHAARPATPRAEQATVESLHQQLDALRTLQAELRAENQRLRDALARKLGQQRANPAEEQ